MTVDESQTAMLKCAANGNPRPNVTWSMVASSLPVRRHMVESSGVLLLKDIRPQDEGIYSCSQKVLIISFTDRLENSLFTCFSQLEILIMRCTILILLVSVA